MQLIGQKYKLHFLPQIILQYWTVQLFVLFFCPEIYKNIFQYLDQSDVIPCFILVIHFSHNLFMKKIKVDSYYFLASMIVLSIAILNALFSLRFVNLYVYYTIYIELLLTFYIYAIYDFLLFRK